MNTNNSIECFLNIKFEMDLSKEEGTRKVEIGTKDDPENKVIELGEYKATSYEEVSNNSLG